MGRETQVRTTFLRSLLHDKTANTIAISAAAMFPVLAMVGGGIDASRFYMAASRMQAACDAGALAARRAMLDDDFMPEHRQVGENFFDQNYSDGMFGTQNRVRTYTATDEGRVDGTASGTLPTTLMGAFGYEEFTLQVTCSADINISNTDIMFVLDVTGSMNCPDNNIAGCTNGNNNEVEVGNSLIVGLRNAVMSFYDTVEEATANTAQVRYGAVPYAHSVNVGFDIPRAFMANQHSYQSRVARYREQFTFIPGNGVEVGDDILISQQVEWLPRNTANFGTSGTNNYRFRGSPTTERNAAITFCTSTLRNTFTVGSERWVVSNTEFRDNVWSGGASNNRSGCRGTVRKTRKATAADVIPDENRRDLVFDGYRYCRVTTGVAGNCGVNNPADAPAGWDTVDLSTLYDDNRIMLPTGANGAMQNHVWDGCIEEANSVNAAVWNPVPDGAFDLNINLLPANQAEQWKPVLATAVYQRLTGDRSRVAGNITTNNIDTTANLPQSLAASCVTRARRLSDISRTDLQAYVNSLRARGATYHDIGMIWGARFIAPDGIFSAANATAPNGDAIARHIVFMTDGALAPNPWVYSPYGMEPWDRRVTADGSTDVNARTEARFQAACRAARQENITVWVVAFGTDLTQSLTDCASPGRAFEASNNAELTEQFREIAQRIAALRLTQ